MAIISFTERVQSRSRAADPERTPTPGVRRLALSDARDQFAATLRTRERSERTVAGHISELRRYAAWLTSNTLDWQDIAAHEVQAYARTRAHLRFSSKASLMVTLRQFYTWAVREALVEQSPASNLQTPSRPAPVPKALSADQVRRLLASLATARSTGLTAQRNEALLLTALYQGMRAAELAGTTWGQVDLKERTITIPLSKMARGRTMQLHPDLVEVLGTWQAAQGRKGADAAWVFSVRGEQLVPNRVGKIARHYAKLLDIPLTAHTLRHTFATWSLRRSGNLYAVSKALGHKHLTQTEVYLRSDPSDSAPAVEALPSRADW